MNFRYKAMQKMREPDELDAPTVLASPRGWVAVMTVLIVTAVAVIWVFAGTLPVGVTATGMLTLAGGTASVQTAVPGTVASLAVRSAQAVTSGTVVAKVQSPEGAVHDIVSLFAGRVVGVAVSEGQVVPVGATIATVERTDAPDDTMVAMLFVPDGKAVGITAGESVDLSVSSAPAAEFGLLRGRIRSVSRYALTDGQLAGLVGGATQAEKYRRGGPPRLIVVNLVKDVATRSGYAWSTTGGAPFAPQTQVTVSGTIDLGSRSPFDLLFGR